MPIAYTAHATSTGGRDGHGRTDDGKLDVQLSLPKEMGGDNKGTNPEQLFAVGYSACYLGAIRFVAGNEKVTIAPDASVAAHVGVGPREDGRGFGLEVALDVHLPGLDKAQAEDITAKAHVVCPYSHATKGNIKVTTKIV
ncbi:organic hydroperoxide resistance protein [Aestuariivirga sp.]|uniref:organic hydroperoxide resistance protein n=1 Tax=Aestuariivirga sp. TaxID=2650926 RepID=UPI0025B7E30F|nr:organic hydroperoxide resistance protein [Aestuariivirga sp.]MCA3554021.1 organic hydroperoxide resistance protein [Aestuariivirga sp.]